VEMVLSQCTQDAQSDLKNQMNAMQKMQQQKQAQRSASELTDQQSLELQMTMDRQSKLIETLSNIEKKMADTQDSVISNLK